MKWVKGLIGAVIGGAANGVLVSVVDPTTFNLQEGFDKLVTVILTSGLVAGAAYLAKSPLPED